MDLNPFGGADRPDPDRSVGDGGFDPYDAFVPAHLPAPGQFLGGTPSSGVPRDLPGVADDGPEPEVLTGREHAAFHRLTRDVFEERGVYDATFGYNLARLNLDPRHPDAGFRYARVPGADGEAPTLRAEFTPTTEFCPQSETLTLGAYRAWNGLADRHEFAAVRVRVAPSHQRAREINETLAGVETGGRTTRGCDGDGREPAPDTGGPSTPF